MSRSNRLSRSATRRSRSWVGKTARHRNMTRVRCDERMQESIGFVRSSDAPLLCRSSEESMVRKVLYLSRALRNVDASTVRVPSSSTSGGSEICNPVQFVVRSSLQPQMNRLRTHSYLNRCFVCGVGRLECICLLDWNASSSHEPLSRSLPAQGVQRLGAEGLR
jgi:hypothetical protein